MSFSLQVSREKSASLNKELQDVSFVLARKVLRPRLSFACGSSSRLFWICRFPDEHQETRRRRKPFSQPDPHSANRIDPDQRMKIWPITRRIVTDFRGGGMSRPRKRRCVPGSNFGISGAGGASGIAQRCVFGLLREYLNV